jgi:phage shock protein E
MGLGSLLGFDKKEKLETAIKEGAVIIDVRTPGEFNSGHIKQSINIPLDRIDSAYSKIKAYDKKVITCCKSGMRSGVAAGKLRKQGIDTINGGAWNSLEQKL